MKLTIRIQVVLLLICCADFVMGQNPSEFKLKSVTDNSQFKLSEARGKFVALHFLLKTECPFCLMHTREYLNNAEKLPDVVQVFIKPDSEEEIKTWTGKLSEESVEFPIYRDPDAKLANQFNVPDGYNFHNQVVHFPALILLDPNGKEVFRYIGESNRDRFSFEQLKSKISELKK